MPSSIIHHWVQEVKTHIDFGNTSPARPFQFKVKHAKWCNSQIKKSDNQNKDGLLGNYEGDGLECYFTTDHVQGEGR